MAAPNEQNQAITADRLILCEGPNDDRFFRALIGFCNPAAPIQVMPLNGRDKFHAKLRAFRQFPGYADLKALLVVRDADFPSNRGGFAVTWQSVMDGLKLIGIAPPTLHGQFDTTGGLPRTAVWLIPGDGGDGLLETLCVRSVASDPAFACVQAYFTCLAAATQPVNLPPHRTDKAAAHAFLASRPEPGCHVGVAAEKKYWNWNAPEMAALIELIRQM